MGLNSTRADAAHLVLEQLAQRLDQLLAHVQRQAADIVMRLFQVHLGEDKFHDICAIESRLADLEQEKQQLIALRAELQKSKPCPIKLKQQSV